MLAQASTSRAFYRREFDISLPLFHKEHPLNDDDDSEVWLLRLFTHCAMPLVHMKLEQMRTIQTTLNRTILVSFKGKRYVYGSGSRTRNTLYHLHNAHDVVMLTTCKHGKVCVRVMIVETAIWESRIGSKCAMNGVRSIMPCMMGECVRVSHASVH
jgi:glucuronyl/N-acetylglucosaminyl transferase EXT1